MARAMGFENADKPCDFITALETLKEKCCVSDLKMPDYGIEQDEFKKMALNAFETMGRLFENDRIQLNLNDCIDIYKKSF